jgi:hypothetical protein
MSDTYGAAAALLEVEAELGQVMTFNGQDFPCVGGASTTKRTVEIGGFSVDYDFEVAVRVAPFTDASLSPPDAQDKITTNGKTYRVVSAITSPCGSVASLLCADDSRGV